MSNKRKPSMSDSPAKRPRISGEDEADGQPVVTPYERPRNHPVYGQKSAFPGLEDGGNDELFYGTAEDGMEYLRMVRSEANALPPLFVAETNSTVAPTPDTQADPDTSVHHQPLAPGFFADEAYIARANLPDNINDETTLHLPEPYPAAQRSYYNLLHHRFLLLRSTLKCTPPATAITSLDETHPISLPRNAITARKEWRRLLLDVNPQMVQLACMDQDSVLAVLGIMSRLMSQNIRSGSAEQVRRFGAWVWGLLGKCRVVGELGTEAVGEIRDLGKRAVRILRKVREVEVRRGVDDENEDEDVDVDSGEDVQAPSHGPDEQSALEAAKARLQAQLQEQVDAVEMEMERNSGTDDEDTTSQTRAMLDMIITVVGEFYGQRDLLEAREIWTMNRQVHT